MNKDFSKEESAWVGTRTGYKNCFHLLPNHYLDVSRSEQIRFYPLNSLPRKETNEIIETASLILQRIMNAINNRYKVTFALTAGWDSRVLLAASKDVSPKMEYYVDKKGILPEDHPDVWIPI